MGGPYQPIKPGRKWFKEATVKAVFLFMGTALEAAAERDPDIAKEVAAWENGFVLMMNVLPSGPHMTFEKADGRLFYRGRALKEPPIAKNGVVPPPDEALRDATVVVNFKSIESAFMVLTPQMGTPRAYAERRLLVKGDLSKVMSFSRCLNILLAHLYPKVVYASLMKRPPRMGLKKQFIRFRIMLDVALNLPGHVRRSS